MRTTINLPDDLLARAKRVALESGKTVTELIADALREALCRRRQKTPRVAVELVTYGNGGLQPGVDLDDTAALLDLMGSADAADRR